MKLLIYRCKSCQHVAIFTEAEDAQNKTVGTGDCNFDVGVDLERCRGELQLMFTITDTKMWLLSQP